MAADRTDGRGSSRESLHPAGEAFAWVARIFAVTAEMFVPGLVGQWLDRQLGTGFLVILGFGFGLTAGLLHLLLMTAQLKRRPPSRGDDHEERLQ